MSRESRKGAVPLFGEATLSDLPCALRSRRFVAPIQGAFAPDVDVPGKQQGHEDHDLDEPGPAEIAERHGPRVEECDFDVEEKKDHRDEVELYRLPLAGVADGRHAAFIGCGFFGSRVSRTE